MRPRYNCVSLEGLDPSGAGTHEFWVEKDLIEFFYKEGLLYKFNSLHSVKEVLPNPAVIFRGLQRDGQEEALCYAGLASCRFTNQGSRVKPRPNETFVIYIREDDVIFRWDWEPADANLTYPRGWQTRFGNPPLWPKN